MGWAWHEEGERYPAMMGQTSVEQWPVTLTVLCALERGASGKVRIYIQDRYRDEHLIGKIHQKQTGGGYAWFAETTSELQYEKNVYGKPELPHATEEAAIYSLLSWTDHLERT